MGPIPSSRPEHTFLRRAPLPLSILCKGHKKGGTGHTAFPLFMLDQYAFRNAKILRSQGKSYESGWQVFQQDDKQFTVSTARVAYVSTEQLLDWINQTRNWNPSSSASHWHPAYSDTEPTFTCSLSTHPLSPLSLTPQWNILRRGCKEHHHFLNCFWNPGNAGIIKMQLSC